MILPLSLSDGSPFPARELAILLAAGVIVVSLLAATIGLSAPASARHQREDRARIAAAEAAILAIQSAQRPLGAESPDAGRHAAAAARLVAH